MKTFLSIKGPFFCFFLVTIRTTQNIRRMLKNWLKMMWFQKFIFLRKEGTCLYNDCVRNLLPTRGFIRICTKLCLIYRKKIFVAFSVFFFSSNTEQKKKQLGRLKIDWKWCGFRSLYFCEKREEVSIMTA